MAPGAIPLPSCSYTARGGTATTSGRTTLVSPRGLGGGGAVAAAAVASIGIVARRRPRSVFVAASHRVGSPISLRPRYESYLFYLAAVSDLRSRQQQRGQSCGDEDEEAFVFFFVFSPSCFFFFRQLASFFPSPSPDFPTLVHPLPRPSISPKSLSRKATYLTPPLVLKFEFCNLFFQAANAGDSKGRSRRRQ